jgi:NADH:ubiquinone reductase (H+-translocating)
LSKHVVILGAGYGGLLTALETRRLLTGTAARITIVDRNPYHQLVTELHQPAAGSKKEHQVRLPLNKLLKGKQIDVLLGDIDSIQLDEHAVHFTDGSKITYDYLVVGLGSETEYFGIPGLKEHSFILKSVKDAQHIHQHIEQCVADYKTSKNQANLTFAIGGAGLTGVELVGEMADNIPALCKKYGVDPSLVKLLSIEAAPSILPGFPETLINRAKSSLEARGVRFLTGVPIVQAESGKIHLKSGEVIESKTLIWTGGVRGHSVVANSGLATEPRGRAQLNDHLESVSHPHVFVVGDSSIVIGPNGRPYPPTAQLAWQMGEHVGRQIHGMLKGSKLEKFVPHFDGTLASLGHKDGIGMIGDAKVQIKGKPALWVKSGSNMRYLSAIGALFTRSKAE